MLNFSKRKSKGPGQRSQPVPHTVSSPLFSTQKASTEQPRAVAKARVPSTPKSKGPHSPLRHKMLRLYRAKHAHHSQRRMSEGVSPQELQLSGLQLQLKKFSLSNKDLHRELSVLPRLESELADMLEENRVFKEELKNRAINGDPAGSIERTMQQLKEEILSLFNNHSLE